MSSSASSSVSPGSSPVASSIASLRIALVGNPNCGKTALFNQLTGSRQKVANYAGVTVERKEGRFTAPSGRLFQLLDLPGAYSLEATSPDEMITRKVCLGQMPGEALPDLVVCVADATNLRLHLRFVLEVKRLGRPMVLALNMMDAARKRGIVIDREELERRLGIPVIETIAVRNGGARDLINHLDQSGTPTLPAGNVDDDLHAQVRSMLAAAVTMPRNTSMIDDAIDRWVLHPVFGLALLAAIMFFIFQAVFSWAQPLMNGIQAGVAAVGAWVAAAMPESLLRSLISDGIFGGLGTVLVFLPQILILFFFILMLEESGYLPRAAFLLDRMMFKAGLTGRSFIPLLSSFACAIPGIMATRSIQDPRDRLTTILVAPLMTCSARLPVYTLLISAFIPNRSVWSLFNLQGIVLFVLYVAGIFSALAVSWIIKRMRKDKSEHALLMELPSYRLPSTRNIVIGLWERALIFLRRVTTIILALTVLLWFLSTFPGPPEGATLPAIDYSLAGRIGHLLEYVFAPIGFNWQICIALVPGMAAREVAVSALGTVYAMSGSEDAIASQLGPMIAHQWSLATALALLAWYVFAPQCMSTLAVMRRETNSWKIVAIATAYLFGLAYLAAFLTYQITRLLT
ncbi:ferrous iron transport protein B [Collimonas arenae]|uniref:Fe(2+) transporter FeoB n=1 Tax=Collimonas arenae TaxID=279058 RepID=A0A127QLZ6_9BURK|nr:ferrous iron transporter B [Collimonas arenae]AMP01170.1 ferrous iron transport protein B [Collimonas arenae]AMP11063.1 ferrous iron transport protein B [Collimonas arenae]